MVESRSEARRGGVAPGARRRLVPVLVVAVDLAALAVLPFLSASGLTERPFLAAVSIAAALLAGVARIRIPALRTHVAVVDAFVFCALATLGGLSAGLTAVAGVLGARLAPGKKSSRLQTAFNLGAVLLSVAAGQAAFTFAGGSPGAPLGGLWLPLALGAAAYCATNMSLVGVVVALEGKTRASLAGWCRALVWFVSAIMAGLALAVTMLAVAGQGPVWALVPAVTGCWLIIALVRKRAGALVVP